MKNFTVKIRFTGLTGEYVSQVDVQARHASAATKKAEKSIGNRDGYVVSVTEALVSP